MYAGFWRRVAAAILDLMILVVPLVTLGIVVALLTGPKSRATLAADLSALVVFWLYFALMESSARQATLGKIAFGIRVVDLRGNRVSFMRASARFFAKIFSALSLALGFLMAGVTRRKQALHDMVASCLLVKAHVESSDLREAGYAQPMSGGGIVALLVAALCVPLAAAGLAVGIPYYQDYVVRRMLEEVVRSGQSAASDVTVYMIRHKTPPRTLEEAQAIPSSPHLRSAAIGPDGSIVLTLAIQRLEGKRIVLVPAKAPAGNIVWTCTTDIPQRYLPPACRR